MEKFNKDLVVDFICASFFQYDPISFVLKRQGYNCSIEAIKIVSKKDMTRSFNTLCRRDDNIYMDVYNELTGRFRKYDSIVGGVDSKSEYNVFNLLIDRRLLVQMHLIDQRDIDWAEEFMEQYQNEKCYVKR